MPSQSWAHFGHTWAQTKAIPTNYNERYFAGQPAYRTNGAGTDCARFAFARQGSGVRVPSGSTKAPQVKSGARSRPDCGLRGRVGLRKSCNMRTGSTQERFQLLPEQFGRNTGARPTDHYTLHYRCSQIGWLNDVLQCHGHPRTLRHRDPPSLRVYTCDRRRQRRIAFDLRRDNCTHDEIAVDLRCLDHAARPFSRIRRHRPDGRWRGGASRRSLERPASYRHERRVSSGQRAYGRGCGSTLGGRGDGSERFVERRTMLKAMAPAARTATAAPATTQGRLL